MLGMMSGFNFSHLLFPGPSYKTIRHKSGQKRTKPKSKKRR